MSIVLSACIWQGKGLGITTGYELSTVRNMRVSIHSYWVRVVVILFFTNFLQRTNIQGSSIFPGTFQVCSGRLGCVCRSWPLILMFKSYSGGRVGGISPNNYTDNVKKSFCRKTYSFFVKLEEKIFKTHYNRKSTLTKRDIDALPFF